MSIHRVRAIFGVRNHDTLGLLARAQAMHDGMAADPAVYAAPSPPLPELAKLVQNVAVAQQVVRWRTLGAAASRDVERDLLFTAMESERVYVQGLADADRGRAIVLIQGAGLVVARSSARPKALLALRLGVTLGDVECDANVTLFMAKVNRRRQGRYFNWQYTVSGETFLDAPSTPGGHTTLHGFAPLTRVGVRVSMTTSKEGTTPWSDVVTILVH